MSLSLPTTIYRGTEIEHTLSSPTKILFLFFLELFLSNDEKLKMTFYVFFFLHDKHTAANLRLAKKKQNF